MTIQGALPGNGAFVFSLTGFFAVKNPRSVALQRKKGNVGVLHGMIVGAGCAGDGLCSYTAPLAFRR
jgi:hypothetical protein